MTDTGTKILVVDDEQDILHTLSMVLKSENFCVRTAQSVKEASELFHRESFDLVITDIRMPGMEGYELIHFVRQADESVEIIVLTGHATIDSAIRALKLGAYDYITKPVEDIDHFLHPIHQALQKRKLFLQNKALHEKMEFLARHDPLTGLPNRSSFYERLENSVKQAKRYHHVIGIMVIDLDHFKTVNDTLGHQAGDHLLNKAASRMRSCIRESDTLARVGGDEFFLLLDRLEHPEDAGIVAERIIRVLEQPFEIEAKKILISASIGIAILPHNSQDGETLIQYADIAMYQVKHSGRHGHCFFTQEMKEKTDEKAKLYDQLQKAWERREFCLRYLPTADIKTNTIRGVEALLYWNHPQKSRIPADSFIPIMEEKTLAKPLFEWMLNTACRQCRRWHEKGFSDLSVSVNVPPSQFGQEGFVGMIQQALDETSLPPQYLYLEIGENTFEKNKEYINNIIKKIKYIGIKKILLNDFGTTFYSLQYLKEYPIDGIKISKDLISEIPQKLNMTSYICAIVGTAMVLDIQTIVAAGVDHSEQLPVLRELGCNLYQGSLCSLPVSAEDLEKLLETYKSLPAHQILSKDTTENRKKILIVEDNFFTQQLIRSFLEKEGCAIDCTDTGEKAVSLFGLDRYHIVFIDICLPGIDGYETARKIRETEHSDGCVCFSSKVPIIGMTAYEPTIMQEKFLLAGMNDFIVKPIEKSEIMKVVDKWVGYKTVSGSP